MVTPIWLNGAGCATAVPVVSVEANSKATHTFVFTDASLLISSCLAMRERYQPAVKMSRAFGAKKRGRSREWKARRQCRNLSGTARREKLMRTNAVGMNRFVISSDGKTLTETKTQIYREVVSECVDPATGKVLKSSTSVLVFDKLF
jgi:hypothetical protein